MTQTTNPSPSTDWSSAALVSAAVRLESMWPRVSMALDRGTKPPRKPSHGEATS